MKKSKSVAVNGTAIFHQNSKVGPDTACFRFSTGFGCRSRSRGLCPVTNAKARGELKRGCYDCKFEILRPNVKRAHENMQDYAQSSSMMQIVRDFGNYRRGRDIKRFRYNVGGDFLTSRDVATLRALALFNPDIRFYGYTATDLPVESLKLLPNIVILRSGVDFRVVPFGSPMPRGRGNLHCIGDCSKCGKCPGHKQGQRIWVREH